MTEVQTKNSCCCHDNLSLERVSKASPPNFAVERKLKSATSTDIENYPLENKISGFLHEIVPLKSFKRPKTISELEDSKLELIFEYRSIQMHLEKEKFDPEMLMDLTPEQARKIVNKVFEGIKTSSARARVMLLSRQAVKELASN